MKFPVRMYSGKISLKARMTQTYQTSIKIKLYKLRVKVLTTVQVIVNPTWVKSRRHKKKKK